MTISGNLCSLELSELLQWLSQGRKTGTLVVRNGRVEKKIILRNGRIISSASTDPHEHLGEFLVGRGYIDRTTLEHARKLQEATQIFLGKVLVTLDSLSQVDLERVMREKTEESLYDLFGWKEGDFEFLRDELPSLAMVPLSLDVTRVVMEGLRRLDERNWKRAGEVEDRASVEARRLERELETVPLADLVAAGAGPPVAELPPETWQRAELREEALAELPDTLQAKAAEDMPSSEAPAAQAPIAENPGTEAPSVETAAEPPSREGVVPGSPRVVELGEPAVEPAPGYEEDLYGGSSAYAGALPAGSRRAAYLAAAAILVAGAVGWGFFALSGPPGTAEATVAQTVDGDAAGTHPVETPGVEALAAPPAGGAQAAGPGHTDSDLVEPTASPLRSRPREEAAVSDAELSSAVDDLVEARSQELESSLKAEYEAKLARLERQLVVARREAGEALQAEPEPARTHTGQTDQALPAGGDAVRGPGEPVTPQPEAVPPLLAAAVLATSGPAAAVPRFASQRASAPPAPDTVPRAAPRNGAAESGAGPATDIDSVAVSPMQQEGGPLPSRQAAAADATPSEPTVREGDLVERGPGVVAPRLRGQPRPVYPPAALRLRRAGSVDVRVLVDETGRAVEVRQVSDTVGLGFDKAALDAAARATWQPATLSGVRVSTWVDLRIEFRP